MIYKERDHVNFIYFILSGEVEISKITLKEKGYLTIFTFLLLLALSNN